MAILGDLEGVLEPCRCTRHASGGVDHAAGVVAELRRAGDPVLTVATGDLFFASPQSPDLNRPQSGAQRAQATLKADALVAVFGRLGLDVAAPGASDFGRGAAQLRALAQNGRTSLLASRASRLAAIDGVDRLGPSVIKQAGPYRVGLLAGADAQAGAVAALRERGAHLVVRLVGPGENELPGSASRERADVMIVSGEKQSGTSIEHGGIRVSPGYHAERLVVLKLLPAPASGGAPAWRLVSGSLADQAPPVARAEEHVLDERSPRDPEVRKFLDQVFARVNSLAIAEAKDIAEDPGEQGPRYVGARSCAACHTRAYFWWTRTRHAKAYQTLVGRGRQLDLECIGCHVTGFEAPGGASLGQLEELKGVGCESCHGPGSFHVDDPQTYKRSVQRSVVESTCVACHDSAHSEAFDYEVRRRNLIAPGHGSPGAMHRQRVGREE